MLRNESAAQRDLLVTIGLLAIVVTFALIGLATDHNWPKILRVSAAFVTYAGILLGFLRVRGPALGMRQLPWHWFSIAAGAAGIVSGLVRPQFDWKILVAGTIAATLLLGTVHWLALRNWHKLLPRPAADRYSGPRSV